MPRKTAGARYPHASSAARQHDHRWCPVVGAVATRARAGDEPWGTEHALPALATEAEAVRIRRGLFRGRDCARLKAEHGELSVSVAYRGEDGKLRQSPPPAGPYVLVLRVWSRDIAKREIARRVKDGESLHYNVMRGSV